MSEAETASSSAVGPSTSRAKMPKPHRCNARVEDFVQVSIGLNETGLLSRGAAGCSLPSSGGSSQPAAVPLATAAEAADDQEVQGPSLFACQL